MFIDHTKVDVNQTAFHIAMQREYEAYARLRLAYEGECGEGDPHRDCDHEFDFCVAEEDEA